ncbi:anthranilate synthase component I family protein [Companilactobacillus jidongensis]|uniref:anthranilate synthase component I family protein n=1 Tax=Companilactobacillus jidongensis TaxID=2486006 RepID=UPI000F786F2C|nr:anthranilate synthase component I family protein [Companilactobacillus jidongensis]
MNLEELKRLSKNYPMSPVTISYQDVNFDPLELMQFLKKNQTACFLFTGRPKSEEDGYSFIGIDPEQAIVYKDGFLNNSKTKTDLKPVIEKILSDNRIPKIPELPPFVGGLSGYLGYDYARFANPTLPQNISDPYNLNDVDLLLVKQVISFNHQTKTVTLSCIVPTSKLDSVYEQTITKLQDLKSVLLSNLTVSVRSNFEITSPLKLQFSLKEFEDKVAKTKRHITDGDIFQLILSNPRHGKIRGSLFTVAKELFSSSPTPYQFYFKHDNFESIGASPETLITKQNRSLYTYPLAGTRRRGKTIAEDKKLANELTTSPKELAEHNMLIDLGRNDLGKISQFGSVKVTRVRELLKFSNVMHMGSTVESLVDDKSSAIDIVESLMPAGTLSGAPKISAMKIISQLEQRKRGIYGGCIGYIDFSGDLDFCIGIRLAYRQNDDLVVHSGAGIVADSIAKNEFQEFNNKASSVIDALKKTAEVRE